MSYQSTQEELTSLNADAAEIDKFERAAERWWDPEGEAKPLHKMNPVRANFIDRHTSSGNSTVVSGVAGKGLLDVGCGGGLLTEAMAQRGAHVTGLDMGTAPLEVARSHAEGSNLDISYQQTTAEQYAAQYPESYDVVTCLEMLEHVPDPASVVEACGGLVKAGGDVFFSTINRTLKAYLVAVLGAEYIAKLLPKGTHEYQKFITPAEMAAACRGAGLEVKRVCGLSFNPLTQNFKESDDTSINYILHATKPQHAEHTEQ